MKNILVSKWFSAVLLSIGFMLIYNPLTQFPYTFITIIVYILLSTYLQNGSFHSLHFGKVGLDDAKIILVAFISLELSIDMFIQPAVNKLCNEPADYSSFHSIKGNTTLFSKWLVRVWISAALGEELLFRAFTFAQLKNIIGEKKSLTIILSAILFCIPHLYQGTAGLILTFFWGLAFGILYMKNRNIWINVIVHGLIDTLFLIVCYFGYWNWYDLTR